MWWNMVPLAKYGSLLYMKNCSYQGFFNNDTRLVWFNYLFNNRNRRFEWHKLAKFGQFTNSSLIWQTGRNPPIFVIQMADSCDSTVATSSLKLIIISWMQIQLSYYERFKFNSRLNMTSKFGELRSPARQQLWHWSWSKVKVTVWCQLKELVTRIMHAKYQCSITSEDMSQVKVFVTDRQTDRPLEGQTDGRMSLNVPGFHERLATKNRVLKTGHNWKNYIFYSKHMNRGND